MWKILTVGTALLSTVLFLCFIGLFLMLLGHQPKTEIEPGSALVLAPYGSVLEKESLLGPAARMLHAIDGTPQHTELLLQDIISGIRAAADDDRIKLLVLAPDRLQYAGLDQLQEIGRAIDEFKKSGKPVIAYGDTFTQGQYYMAARSDEVYLHPMGEVDLHGFGVFQLHVRDLLDKLRINFHVFRVGTFKSAVEPLLRNDMSPEVKEANLQWLTSLWQRFCADIAAQRGISVQDIEQLSEQLPERLAAAGGNSARMALNTGLIDGIKTKAEVREHLISLVGENRKKTGFKQVAFTSYVETLPAVYSRPAGDRQRGIAILVAQGDIIYGDAEVGQISASGVAKTLRKMRRDRTVGAVVLRIDSGGGSVFGSEVIRQELIRLQQAGKPVVVSMAATAASGAYWLAADADKIVASSGTITGSIGIFAAFPTVEQSLAEIGVYSDGVGTTKLAGEGDLTRPLSEDTRRAVQMNIKQTYRQFVRIVAEGRKMDPAAVDEVAQGRVWDGTTALEIGLVDQLGGLEEAVATAAELTGIPADRAFYFEGEKTPFERLLVQLETAHAELTGQTGLTTAHSFRKLAEQLLRSAGGPSSFLPKGDPRNIYSHCLLPSSIL